MRKISYLIIFFLINNCSFDNKSGIWTGSNQVKKNSENTSQNIEFIFAPPAIAFAIGAYLNTLFPETNTLVFAIGSYFIFTFI